MTNFAKTVKQAPIGIAQQTKWEQAYLKLMNKFLEAHYEFDGSAVAKWMRAKGLHDPIHHNHWGKMISYFARQGDMTAVGKGIPSGAAHISTVRIWRSNKFKGTKP